MKICLYGASSSSLDNIYYLAAEELGKALAKRGHTLVFGGGATGLMGAAVSGVASQGGCSIGIAPRFFDSPGVLYENCSEFIFTDTMRERKQLMEDMSDGFIMSPGGIGTFEEFFEIATLKQLGRHTKPIAVFNVNNYYDQLNLMIEKGIKENFIECDASDIYQIFSDAEQLLDYIEQNCPKSV